MHEILSMNICRGEGETLSSEFDKGMENALHQVSEIGAAALSLEAIAYELAVHLEPAKVANLINISAYLQRFAERCESDLSKAVSA